MALSKSTITGRVPLPTDEVLQYAELTFALSGLDTQGADVLPGGIIKRVTLVNSELPAGFKLWRNIIATDNIIANGLAMFLPAMSGAEP